jgi:hypothetical protein
MLLPEIVADNGGEIIPPDQLPVDSWLHIQPTQWESLGNGGWQGRQGFPGYFSSTVTVTPEEDGLALEWTLRNESARTFREPYGNFCLGSGWAGTGFAPPDGWFNADFQEPQTSAETEPAKQPQDLYRQFVDNWLDHLARKNVWVHEGSGWERYSCVPHTLFRIRSWDLEVSEKPVSRIALESLDGTKVLAQGWSVPGRACIGPHLCIHLCPVVAEELRPGEAGTITGAAYLLEGGREEVLERCRKEKGDGERPV